MKTTLLGLLALSAGCIVDAPGDGVPALQFTLGASASEAGIAVPYEASFVWPDGASDAASATITSDLEPNLAVAADGLTPTLAGSHMLRAAAELEGHSFETEAALEVSAGETTALSLTLAAETTTPEVPVGFVLEGHDAFGNAADVAAAELTADGGLVFGGDTVGGTAAGDWTVTATLDTATATAPLHIDAGAPATITLELNPAPEAVATSTVVADAWDNPIAGADVELSATGGTYTVVADSVYLTDEGVYFITATVAGTAISDTEGPIVHDTVVPELVVTTPARSTWAEVGPGVVAGTASDTTSGVDTLTVNGDDVVRSGTDWSFDTGWEFGINILETEATDVGGLADRDVRAVLAGDLLDPGEPLDEGVMVRLNEGSGGLDSLAEAAGEPVDPAVVLAALPVPLYDESYALPFGLGTYSLTMTVDAVAWASSALTLDPQADGTLFATLTITDFEADWTGTVDSPSASASTITGTATASEISVEFVLELSVVDGVAQVEVTSVTTDISADLDLGLDSATATVVAALGVDPEAELESALDAAAQDEFAEEVAAEVESQLADLEIEKHWALGDTFATLTATPASIEVDDTGITLAFATRIVLDEWVIGSAEVGSPVYGYGTPVWTATPGTQMAFSADFVNQVFHAAWGAGSLGFEKTDEELTIEMTTFSVTLPGISELVATTAPTLPPVVVPDPGGMLSFDIGDYSILLYDQEEVPGAEVYRMYFDSLTPMTLGLTDGALDATLGTPAFWADVDSAPATADRGDIEDALELALPALHLNGTRLVGDLPLPDLAGYELSGAAVTMAGAEGGYVVMGGDLLAP